MRIPRVLQLGGFNDPMDVTSSVSGPPHAQMVGSLLSRAWDSQSAQVQVRVRAEAQRPCCSCLRSASQSIQSQSPSRPQAAPLLSPTGSPQQLDAEEEELLSELMDSLAMAAMRASSFRVWKMPWQIDQLCDTRFAMSLLSQDRFSWRCRVGDQQGPL